MNIPEEVLNSIFDEVKKELKENRILSSKEPQTFDDIEGELLNLRQRFSEKLTEAVLEVEAKKCKKKLV